MNSENFYDAFENISDELILEAFDEPKKNFHSVKKLKWTVLAAIIALFVSVPVLAEVFNVNFFYNEVADSYDFAANARIKETELSEELRGSITGESNTFYFNTMKEAEEFIGIDFPKNRTLIATTTHYIGADGSKTERRYGVHVFANESGEIESVMCRFSTWNADSVMYIFTTDKASGDGGVFYYRNNDSQRSSEPEKYVTAAGYECFITDVSGNGIIESSGILVIDRMLINISALGENVWEARENLIRKLEAFE